MNEPKVPSLPRRLARGLARFLIGAYFTVDPRSLAIFRIALGALLFVDMARRWPDLAVHYSNDGWLTNHFALFRPMSNHLFSIYHAFSTQGEVQIIFGLHLLVCLLLMVGWHTRLMHVLAAILTASINNRNVILENGGFVVLTLLVVWSMFLPTGRRYSVDAFLASWRRQRETSPVALNEPLVLDKTPVVSLAVFALILQWAIIYFFNVVHKNGASWKDGTAVHYFFEQDRMVTTFGAWLRPRLPLEAIQAMTWGALVSEALIALLLLVPFGTRYTRMVAGAICFGLHFSIDSVVELGPFSYAMMTVFFVFIPKEFWEWALARGKARSAVRTWLYDSADGFSIQICRFIRRFDGFHLVRFQPLEGANPPEGEPREPVLPAVMDESGGRFTGPAAVRRLAEALPFPRIFTRMLVWPGIRHLLSRLLEGDAARRRERSRQFGVEGLAALPDRNVQKSRARRRLERLGWATGQLLLIVLIVAETSQVLVENGAVPASLKPKRRPEWMEAIVIYPRLFQGWSMFAPSPPMGDGIVVVDGKTVDGRHIDPLTGRVPRFDLDVPEGLHMNQLWGEFHRRIAENRFSAYHDGLRNMLANYDKITGVAEDRLVSFDVWFISQNSAPPGKPPNPTTRRKLFSYEQRK